MPASIASAQPTNGRWLARRTCAKTAGVRVLANVSTRRSSPCCGRRELPPVAIRTSPSIGTGSAQLCRSRRPRVDQPSQKEPRVAEPTRPRLPRYRLNAMRFTRAVRRLGDDIAMLRDDLPRLALQRQLLRRELNHVRWERATHGAGLQLYQHDQTRAPPVSTIKPSREPHWQPALVAGLLAASGSVGEHHADFTATGASFFWFAPRETFEASFAPQPFRMVDHDDRNHRLFVVRQARSNPRATLRWLRGHEPM